MIDDHSVLGVILARGGSKGVPRKNVLDLAGRPLIAWTIEAALGAECIDDLILSSDDDEIMRVAREHGCSVPFRRPDALAQDESTSIDALLHALDQAPGYEHVAARFLSWEASRRVPLTPRRTCEASILGTTLRRSTCQMCLKALRHVTWNVVRPFRGEM
jgi:2-C-methyl-D-erythritol 4-phosphate cytidylyltransferase